MSIAETIKLECKKQKIAVSNRCKYHFEGLCDFKKAPHEKQIESHLLADLQCKIGKFAVNVHKSKKYTKNFDTSKLEKQLDRLNNVYIMGNISDAEYQKKAAEIKRQIAEMKKPSTAPVVPAEVSEMLSDKSFADIYNSLSDKEKTRSMALCNRPYRVRYGGKYNRDFLYSLINVTERLCN